jgi:hypothetical protein
MPVEQADLQCDRIGCILERYSASVEKDVEDDSHLL